MIIECIECKHEYPLTREYFQRNQNYKHGYRTVCKQCLSARRKKQYRENHQERIKKRKEYRSKNKERIKLEKKKWREKYRDIINQKKRDYYKTEHGRDIQRIHVNKRKALKESLPNTFTLEEWIRCKEAFSNCCAYCGKKKKLEQDHFIPLSSKGAYVASNILPACKTCNVKKYNHNFFDWYKTEEFYSPEREFQILSYLEYAKLKEVA